MKPTLVNVLICTSSIQVAVYEMHAESISVEDSITALETCIASLNQAMKRLKKEVR